MLRASLHRRLLVAVVGLVAGVVLVAAVGMWLTTRAALLDEADSELSARLDELRLAASATRPLFHAPVPRIAPCDPHRFLLFMDAGNGRELVRSLSLIKGLSLGQAGDIARTNDLGDGRRVRVRQVALPRVPVGLDAVSVALPRQTSFPDGVLAIAGVDLVIADAALTRLATGLALLWLVAVALAAIAAHVLSRLVLHPLAVLTTAVGRLGPDDLAARLPTGLGPVETHGLVERLNHLFDRVEQAFRREQTTIANLAHELRTPVAGLRSRIEFRLLTPVEPGERAVLHGCLDNVGRMQGLIANLLMLARLEAGHEPLANEEADVVALVRSALAAHEPTLTSRDIGTAMDLPEVLLVRTSPAHLRLILDNLVGNAAAHASEGGTVTITWADGGLILENPHTGALAGDQLGQAFYRGDPARPGGHSGLGLALCARLAALLDLRLGFAVDHGRFRVELASAAWAHTPAQPQGRP